jgi:hypothetical protein
VESGAKVGCSIYKTRLPLSFTRGAPAPLRGSTAWRASRPEKLIRRLSGRFVLSPLCLSLIFTTMALTVTLFLLLAVRHQIVTSWKPLEGGRLLSTNRHRLLSITMRERLHQDELEIVYHEKALILISVLLQLELHLASREAEGHVEVASHVPCSTIPILMHPGLLDISQKDVSLSKTHLPRGLRSAARGYAGSTSPSPFLGIAAYLGCNPG